MEWYVMMWKRAFDFEGRSRRKEYWMVFLVNFVIGIVLNIIDTVAGLQIGGVVGILGAIYSLVSFIPGLALAIRRLHDTGRSGWMLLVAFVPCVGAILLLVWFIEEGKPGSNKFGSDPKGRGARRRDDDDDDDYDDRPRSRRRDDDDDDDDRPRSRRRDDDDDDDDRPRGRKRDDDDDDDYRPRRR